MRYFEHDWFSEWIPIWDKMLLQIIKDDPLHFLEIGSFEGKCTTYLLDNWLEHDDSTITCVDTFEGGVDQTELNLANLYDRFLGNISGYEHKVDIRRGYSYEKLLELNNENKKYDLIYVDASHLAKNVLEDIVLSFNMCKVGGIIALDDYLWPSPQEIVKLDKTYTPFTAIEAFLICYADKIEILHKGYQVMVKKIKD